MLKNAYNRLRVFPSSRTGALFGGALAISLVAMVFLLNNYTPLEIGPNGILLFFLVLYIVLFLIVVLLLKALRKLFHRTFPMTKAINLASVLAFAPVMLLALNTINQLQFLDIILVCVFELLAIFYISRRGK